MEDKKIKQLQPLIISVLAHLWLGTLLYLLPSTQVGQMPVPVEVTYLNETKSQQIVTDPETELQKELEKLKDKVDRLSRVTRRVREEQIAREKDRTQNQFAKPQQQQQLPQDDRPSISKRFDASVAKNLALGNSAIAEYIPEVREGGFTSLNTDQFLHYTFYARINEQIRNRWVTSIRQVVDAMDRMDLQQLARRPQITQVEILLTPTGEFVKAIVHREAEKQELDRAVLTAFRLATPFVNPPEEIVQADGYIHLHYGFYVEFRPRHIAGSK